MPKPPAFDPAALDEQRRSLYPEPFRARMGDRMKKKLGDAGGLTQFGVNLTTLGPNAQSALRHWHTHEDEFVYVLKGEVTLVTNAGEQPLHAGEFAAFKAGTETRTTSSIARARPRGTSRSARASTSTPRTTQATISCGRPRGATTTWPRTRTARAAETRKRRAPHGGVCVGRSFDGVTMPWHARRKGVPHDCAHPPLAGALVDA